MIRLTLMLLAAIGVTMSVAGQDLDSPQGIETGVEVARAETDLSESGMLALDDEIGAIRRAIAATDNFDSATLTELVQPATLVEPAAAATPPAMAVVNAARVNLRAGPSTANPVLDQALRNQQVQIVEETGDGWARVRVIETGTTAWIFDRFLTPQG